MTEKEFWIFLNNALSKGTMMLASGTIDINKQDINDVGAFVEGHSLLPQDYDKISIEKICEIGALLNKSKVSLKTKQAILVLLAHHPSKSALSVLEAYNKKPDKELRIFAELALDECRIWNE